MYINNMYFIILFHFKDLFAMFYIDNQYFSASALQQPYRIDKPSFSSGLVYKQIIKLGKCSVIVLFLPQPSRTLRLQVRVTGPS